MCSAPPGRSFGRLFLASGFRKAASPASGCPSCALSLRLTLVLLDERRHAGCRAHLSTQNKIQVSEWPVPNSFSHDLAAQQVSKAEVRKGSSAVLSRMPSGCKAPTADPVASARPLASIGKPDLG